MINFIIPLLYCFIEIFHTKMLLTFRNNEQQSYVVFFTWMSIIRFLILSSLIIAGSIDKSHCYDFERSDDSSDNSSKSSSISSFYKPDSKRYYIGKSVGLADMSYGTSGNINYSRLFSSSLTSNKVASLSFGMIYNRIFSFELSHDFSGKTSNNIHGLMGNDPSRSSSQFSITKLEAFISLPQIDQKNRIALILGVNRTMFQANYQSATGLISSDLYTSGSSIGYSVGISYIHDITNDVFTRVDARYIKNSFGGIVNNSKMYTVGIFMKL